MNKQLKADIALLGITIIWGASFTLMKEGINDIPPYTFTAMRYSIGAIVLALVFYKRMKNINRETLKYGGLIGLVLSGGAILQILGLQYTTASKSGFITGLCVVFVPVFLAVITKKLPKKTALIGILLSLLGLGMLTLGDELGINKGDLLTLISAVFFAFQIILIDKYAPDFDSVAITVVELGTISIISLVLGFFMEGLNAKITGASLFAILFTGLLCSALAYWVQMDMQKHTTATHAAVIFLGEPVFSAIIAAIFLKEAMTLKMIIGCGLILGGMIVSEFNS